MKEVFETTSETRGNDFKDGRFASEDASRVKAAVFYSIASTQKGLQVIVNWHERKRYSNMRNKIVFRVSSWEIT